MRLLFVHEVNWRRKVVYEIHDYPELLSLRGHDVVFLDFPEDEPAASRARMIGLRTHVTRGLARAHPGAAVEVRTPGRVFPPPLDRLLASVTQVPALWRTLSRGYFDAMILYAVPTNGWQALAIAHHFDVPVLFRAIDISHLLRKTVFGPLIRVAERYIYRNADAISTHNRALRDYCIAQGARPDTTAIEYPGVDLERFTPGPRSPDLCAQYGIRSEDRVVLFMGTLYRFAGLDWLLRAIAPTLTRNPTFRLLIVGGGEEAGSLRALVAELRLERSVIFTGVIDYPRLADHLRLADVAFNTFRSSLATNAALPGKVLQYLACGIATVCTPLDGLAGMFPEGSGILYRELDATFVDAIESLLLDDSARRALSTAGRKTIESLCRWDRCIEDFERAIRRAIDARNEVA